jgi:threonylcarbamoyladenosine tRNA methylthiotransferase MtaB
MKIAFHTLGCKVNQYESEALQEKFKAAGHDIVAETMPADVYIINTCTVTGLADRKSRQFIRKLRKLNPDCILAVIGCYAQLQPEEIAAIEGVNIVAGTNEKAGLVEIVENYDKNGIADIHHKDYASLTEFEEIGGMVSMNSRTRAYIKIQDGCNRFCAYCVVPYARGNIRSRDKDSIIDEAKKLLDAGYKEIVLTGINTALYGAEDQHPSTTSLENIVADLNDLPGVFRIRLSSLEPTVIDADAVKRLLAFQKLCPHFHLSLQSGSDRILKKMKRNYQISDYKEIIHILREHDPFFAVTTDIIVGFPGETESDFCESCQAVSEIGFSKVHVFKYSKRSGTEAAEMPEQIDPAEKNRRSGKLLHIESEAGAAFLTRQIDTIRTVLIEEVDEKNMRMSGYTDNYIRVYMKLPEANSNQYENTFMKAKLTGLLFDGMQGVSVETLKEG